MLINNFKRVWVLSAISLLISANCYADTYMGLRESSLKEPEFLEFDPDYGYVFLASKRESTIETFTYGLLAGRNAINTKDKIHNLKFISEDSGLVNQSTIVAYHGDIYPTNVSKGGFTYKAYINYYFQSEWEEIVPAPYIPHQIGFREKDLGSDSNARRYAYGSFLLETPSQHRGFILSTDCKEGSTQELSLKTYDLYSRAIEDSEETIELQSDRLMIAEAVINPATGEIFALASKGSCNVPVINANTLVKLKLDLPTGKLTSFKTSDGDIVYYQLVDLKDIFYNLEDYKYDGFRLRLDPITNTLYWATYESHSSTGHRLLAFNAITNEFIAKRPFNKILNIALDPELNKVYLTTEDRELYVWYRNEDIFQIFDTGGLPRGLLLVKYDHDDDHYGYAYVANKLSDNVYIFEMTETPPDTAVK